MKVKIVAATTHLDSHFTRISKEALVSAAVKVSSGKKPTIGIEHDVTLPPMGKILEAWVEPAEDGEYQLVETGEIFEETQVGQLSDGMILLKQECETDRSPFAIDDQAASEKVVLAYDWVNFASREDRDAFIEEIRNSTDLHFEEINLFRKSAVPDPEIIIKLSEMLVQFFLAKSIIDKVGDKVIEISLEEVAKFYAFVRSSIISMAKYAVPKNRPVTYIFEVPGNPYIEFVARSNSANLIISAVNPENLINEISIAHRLHQAMQAEKVQFLLSAEGKWEFNYLLTNTGAVIGTPKSFSRRDQRFKLMQEEIEVANSKPQKQDESTPRHRKSRVKRRK